MKRFLLLAALALTTTVPVLGAEEPPACPLHAAHSKADAELDLRGDKVMGFDHSQTIHHFLIEPEGGVIQVEATDPADSESRKAIRSHLSDIAAMFSRGDFSSPYSIHQRVMPGVPVLIQKKDAIQYRYEEIEKGARVRIVTSDADAVAAVHDFLGAQIGDHRTGDPVHAHEE
ncbi:MAG TPA: hypothetical protein VN493_27970 [Thermoanaerobaculia bacterium]|nr:hypothetical protein [Thermoanaerobaculia bacterium]